MDSFLLLLLYGSKYNVFDPLGGRIGCCWSLSADCASLLFMLMLVLVVGVLLSYAN